MRKHALLATVAATVAAFTTSAMAESTFTGKDQTCLIGEKADNIDSLRGAVVLVVDANGRAISLRIKHGYNEMLDPISAVAAGLDSFRELLLQSVPLGGDSRTATITVGGVWQFIYNSHDMVPSGGKKPGRGYMACAPNIAGAPNIKGASDAFDLAANRAAVE